MRKRMLCILWNGLRDFVLRHLHRLVLWWVQKRVYGLYIMYRKLRWWML